MKQILINCVMQRENLQDAMALAESPRDEFVAKGLEKLKKNIKIEGNLYYFN